MREYVWYSIRTDEIILSSHEKYPNSARTKLVLLDETGYWHGLYIITSDDFICLGEL